MLETILNGGTAKEEQDIEVVGQSIPHNEDLLRPAIFAYRLRNQFSRCSDLSLKFAKSLGLNAGSSTIFWVGDFGAGVLGSNLQLFNRELAEPLTLGALALTGIAMTASVLVNAEVNVRMIRNEQIGFNPNFLSMWFDQAAKKFAPNWEGAHDFSVRAASYSWDIAKQVGVITATSFDPNAIIFVNGMGSILNSTQAYLGWKYHKSKQQ